MGRDLNDRLQMYEGGKGKSKGKRKDKGKGKANGKGKHSSRHAPLSWDEMTQQQKWYVRNYRNGSLHAWFEDARNAYRPRTGDTPHFMFFGRDSDAHAGASEHS